MRRTQMIASVVSASHRFAHDIAIDTARAFHWVLLALLMIAIVVLMVSPWILLFSGGWHLFLLWYVLPYPFVFLGFALILALVHRRELLVRVRNWRAARKAEGEA